MNFPTEEERRGKQRSVALAANKVLYVHRLHIRIASVYVFVFL